MRSTLYNDMPTAYDVKTTAYIVFKILLTILKERDIIIQAPHIIRRKFSIYIIKELYCIYCNLYTHDIIVEAPHII